MTSSQYVYDHMIDITLQQEERRNHLNILYEQQEDLTRRVKLLEEHLVKSRDYNLQQAKLILQLQKRMNALVENKE